jgi:YVTN family beta-propeller protein
MPIELGRDVNIMRDLTAKQNLNVQYTITSDKLKTNEIFKDSLANYNDVTRLDPPMSGAHLSIAISAIDADLIAVGDSQNDLVRFYRFDSTKQVFVAFSIVNGAPGSLFGTHVSFNSNGEFVLVVAPKAYSFEAYPESEDPDYPPEFINRDGEQNRGCMYRLDGELYDQITALEIPLDAQFKTDYTESIEGYVGFETYYSTKFTVDATSNIGAEFNAGLNYGTVYSLSYERGVNKQYTIMNYKAYVPLLTQPYKYIPDVVTFPLYDTDKHNLQLSCFCSKYADYDEPTRLISDRLPSVDALSTRYLTCDLTTNTVSMYGLHNNDTNRTGRVENAIQPELITTYSDSIIQNFGNVFCISPDGTSVAIGGTYDFRFISPTENIRFTSYANVIRKLIIDSSNEVIVCLQENGWRIYRRASDNWVVSGGQSGTFVDVQIQPQSDINNIYVLTLDSDGLVGRRQIYWNRDLKLNARVLLGEAQTYSFNEMVTPFVETIERGASRLRPMSAMSANASTYVIIIPYKLPDGQINVIVRIYDAHYMDNAKLLQEETIELAENYGPYSVYMPDVCISGDGNTIAVAGRYGTYPLILFRRSNEYETFDISYSDVEYPPYAFGIAPYQLISMSYDGNTIAFPFASFDFGEYNVYVYNTIELLTGEYTDPKYTIHNIYPSEQFDSGDLYIGARTLMSPDGNTIVCNLLGNFYNGNLRVFKWNGTEYALFQILSGPSVYSWFGWFLNWSNDQNTLVTGVSDSPGGLDSGSVQVFKKNALDGKYELSQTIYPEYQSPDQIFAGQVLLSGDGKFLFINQTKLNSMVIYIYKWNGNKYIPVGSMEKDSVMISCALDSTGTIMIIPEYKVLSPTTIIVSPTLYEITTSNIKDTTVQGDFIVKGLSTVEDLKADYATMNNATIDNLAVETVTVASELVLKDRVTQQTAVQRNKLTSTLFGGQSFFNYKDTEILNINFVKYLQKRLWIIVDGELKVLDPVYGLSSSEITGVLDITTQTRGSNIIALTSTSLYFVECVYPYNSTNTSLTDPNTYLKSIATIYNDYVVITGSDDPSGFNQVTSYNIDGSNISTVTTHQGLGIVRVINNKIWTTSSQFDTVTILDMDQANGQLTKLYEAFVGGFPVDIASTDGYAWVLNSATYNVTVINTETYQVVSTIDMGYKPYSEQSYLKSLVVIDAYLFASDLQNANILVIDTERQTLVDKIETTLNPNSITTDDIELIVSTQTGISFYKKGTISTNGPIIQKADISGMNILGDTTVQRLVTDTIGTKPDFITLTKTIAVGNQPRGILYTTGYIWVTNSGGDTVTVIDSLTKEVIQTIQVGNEPMGITFYNGYIWVANSDSGTVSVIDPVTRSVVGYPISVENAPYTIAYGKNLMWVTNSGSDTISVINPDTQLVVGDPIPVGSQPRGITYANDYMWVVNSGDDTVSVVKQYKFEVGNSFEVYTNPDGILYALDLIWVVNSGSDNVTVYDPYSGVEVHLITVESQPTSILYAYNLIWVTNTGDDSVTVIDPNDYSTAKIDGFNAPKGITYGSQYIWVTNSGDGTVSTVNPYTRIIENDPIIVESNPTGLTYDSTNVWVTNADSGTVSIIKPYRPEIELIGGFNTSYGIVEGEGLIWVTNSGSGTVSVIEPSTKEVIQTITVELYPTSIIYASGSIWVTNTDSGTVSVIDPSTKEVIQTIPVGLYPVRIIYASDLIWVTNSESNNVSVIDPATKEVIQTITVGLFPTSIIYALDLIWVINYYDDSVTVIDPVTQSVFGDPIPVGSYPLSIIYASDLIWVTNSESGTVTVIDPDTQLVVGDPIPVGLFPINIIYASDLIWVTNSFSDSVSVIDPSTKEVIQTIAVGYNPVDIIFVDGYIWVTNSGIDTISIIDPSNKSIIETVVSGGLYPLNLIYYGGSVWVTNTGDNTVSVIQPRMNLVTVDTVSVGNGPCGIIYAADVVWVTNAGDGAVSVIYPDNGTVFQTIPVGDGPCGITYGDGYIWVTNAGSGTVSVIDAVSYNVVVAPIQVENVPKGITAHSGYVWVANSDSGTVSVIYIDVIKIIGEPITVGASPTDIEYQAGYLWVTNTGNNTVSVINPDTKLVVQTITVGSEPCDLTYGAGYIWVTNSDDDTVSVINSADGTIVGSPIDVGSQPCGIVFANGYIWVLNKNDNTVIVLSTNGNDSVSVPLTIEAPLTLNSALGVSIHQYVKTDTTLLELEYKYTVHYITGSPGGPFNINIPPGQINGQVAVVTNLTDEDASIYSTTLTAGTTNIFVLDTVWVAIVKGAAASLPP